MSIKNYSVYSTDGGMLKINDIINQDFTKKTNKAVITDLNTMMGVPPFMEACNKQGVEPVVGATVTIGTEDSKYGNITLYAKNQTGFDNLKKIISTTTEDKDKRRYTNFINIVNNADGLIALTGGHDTVFYNLMKKGDKASAAKHIYNLNKIFKTDLNFEIQVNYVPKEDEINKNIIEFANELGLKVYATNDNKMINEGHYPLLLEKAKVKRGVNNKTNQTLKESLLPSQYVKSSELLARNFKPYLSNVSNLSTLFSNIEPLDLFVDVPKVPNFPGIQDDSYFTSTLNQKYKAFIKNVPEDKRHLYQKRLKEELELIKEFGFENYFVIFEQIEKNKADGQRFNLRGSSVSFLTTHILGLSDIDPVATGLLPERFLNRNRLIRHELPDIDLESNDIPNITKYLVSAFGEKRTAYLSSVETMKSKTQIEFVERALKQDIENKPTDAYGKERYFPQKEFDFLKKVLSCYWGANKKPFQDLFDSNVYATKKSVARTFKLGNDYNSKEFKDLYYKISNMKNLCKNYPEVKKIIGYINTANDFVVGHKASTGSILVSNEPIESYFSTREVNKTKATAEKGVNLAIESTKKHVEKIGLIKLDVLSNLYLGKLEKAYKLTGLPWDDGDYNTKYKNKDVFEMIGKGFTQTLNQLKAEDQQALAKKINVSNFDELVSLLALLRPGVKEENVETYINNKHNQANIKYDHPKMKEILESTHGVIIFEEQVMQIAKSVGNFTKEEADDLRSLMKKIGNSTKKDETYYKLEEMKKTFMTKAIEENKISPTIVKNIINKLEDMQGYTFSKAHSLSYGALVYKQALVDLKCPAEYIQSHFLTENHRIDDPDELNIYFDKMTKMNRTLLNADINRSIADFKTRKKGELYYVDPSLSFVTKDDKLTNIILKERKNGKFENIYDFIERTIHQYTGKGKFDGDWIENSNSTSNSYRINVSNLIKSGAFDAIAPKELKDLGIHNLRTSLLNSLESAIELATNPFSMEDFVYKIPEESLSIEATLENEKQVYGFSPSEIRENANKPKNPAPQEDRKRNRNRP